MSAFFSVSDRLLKSLLLVPKEWNICEVVFKGDGTIVFYVEGVGVEPGHNGEIRGVYSIHRDDGGKETTTVQWIPVPSPHPPKFMRLAGTDICFWCRKTQEHHGEGLSCGIEWKDASL